MNRLDSLLEVFRWLEWEMYYPSVAVDLLSFITTPRGAVRIPMWAKDLRSVEPLFAHWAGRSQFDFEHDELYMVIAKRKEAGQILKIDASPFLHTQMLGSLLGYPECCSSWAETVGEPHLDDWEEKLFKTREYTGKWRLIDHRLYAEGKALISHIPCSEACQPSLILATQTYAAIRRIACYLPKFLQEFLALEINTD